MLKKIKVMVVDDSALMRKIVSDMINDEIGMEVIDTAKNGEDLLSKVTSNAPDVITLDIEMPKMDGMETLRELKKNKIDIPVIILSSISKTSTELTMDCLQLGAFDFIEKPSGAISLDINKVKEELVEKIKLAFIQGNSKNSVNAKKSFKVVGAKCNITANTSINEIVAVRNRNIVANNVDAVVIGASTGGPKALYQVITALSDNIGVPVFVVQHMPPGFTKAFADRLNLNSKIKVVEAGNGENVEKNVVYIAPGGFHMEIGTDNKIHLNTGPTLWGVRPCVDNLFLSATKVYGSRLLSVILTGMGKDGAKGTESVKDSGGITMAEHKSTCIIYGMPKAAFETGKVDAVVLLQNVAEEINKLVTGR